MSQLHSLPGGHTDGWVGGRLHLDVGSCSGAEPWSAHRDAKGALARVHRDPREVGDTLVKCGEHRVVTRV